MKVIIRDASTIQVKQVKNKTQTKDKTMSMTSEKKIILLN